jgi:hypothetical protein
MVYEKWLNGWTKQCFSCFPYLEKELLRFNSETAFNKEFSKIHPWASVHGQHGKEFTHLYINKSLSIQTSPGFDMQIQALKAETLVYESIQSTIDSIREPINRYEAVKKSRDKQAKRAFDKVKDTGDKYGRPIPFPMAPMINPMQPLFNPMINPMHSQYTPMMNGYNAMNWGNNPFYSSIPYQNPNILPYPIFQDNEFIKLNITHKSDKVSKKEAEKTSQPPKEQQPANDTLSADHQSILHPSDTDFSAQEESVRDYSRKRYSAYSNGKPSYSYKNHVTPFDLPEGIDESLKPDNHVTPFDLDPVEKE